MKNRAKEKNRSEHAIVTDREIDEGKYSKTGNNRMAQHPTERGLEVVKQHVIDKPAHAQSSRNLTDTYTKTASPRKDHFCLLPYCTTP
jgi:hypothetical protein